MLSDTKPGPSEVTLFGTEAFHKVHGPDSTCGRAAYYDLLHPMVSLDTTRDPIVHAHLRRVWDREFSIRCKASDSPFKLRFTTQRWVYRSDSLTF